jgi:hypothetical protein
LRQPVVDQPLLRAEQRALRVEERQVAVDAGAVAVFRHPVIVLGGLHQAALGVELIVVGLARGEAVGDFLEGGLDRLFVLRDADVLLQLRVVEAGPQAAGIEDRQVDLRLEGPAA